MQIQPVTGLPVNRDPVVQMMMEQNKKRAQMVQVMEVQISRVHEDLGNLLFLIFSRGRKTAPSSKGNLLDFRS